VYKKYIKRNGKTYGPYYYRTHRVNGKVVTKYVGPEGRKRIRRKQRALISDKAMKYILFTLAVLALFLIIVNQIFITGQAISNLTPIYSSGEILYGEINFTLNAGELVPMSSVVVATLGNISMERTLSELVGGSLESISDNFYISGSDIEGFGEGYGIIGEKEIPIDVEFEVRVYEDSGEGEEDETEEIVEEEESEGNETLVEEEIEDEGNETLGESEDEEIVEEDEDESENEVGGGG